MVTIVDTNDLNEKDAETFIEDIMKFIRLKIIATDPLRSIGNKDELETKAEEVMLIIADAMNTNGETILGTLNSLEIAAGVLQIYVRTHAPK